MNKIIFSVLYYVIGITIILIFTYQMWETKMFRDEGPRFTGDKGQELCERIKKLEKHSYGFQNSGLPILDCNYYETKNKKEQK